MSIPSYRYTAFLTQKGFIIEKEKIPPLHSNEVLIQTVSCGICEGDLFYYLHREELLNSQEKKRLGHEASGIIVQVGKDIDPTYLHQPVTVLGGEYSTYITAPQGTFTIVPDSIPVGDALGEPIACCIAAAERFGICLGDRVLVLGAGFMGLISTRLAYLLGAGEIGVIDLLEWRLTMATQFGADWTKTLPEFQHEISFPSFSPFDVVIEAAGTSSAIQLATQTLRYHGHLNLVGYHQSQQGLREIDMKTWNFKALTVENCHIRNQQKKYEAMIRGLKLRAQKRLSIEHLLTHFPFSSIQEAFNSLASRQQGIWKVLLTF